MKILIIDDNRDLADGYGLILEDEGHSVHCAYTGSEGWAVFERQPFDLVLLDVRLPDINGVILMRRMCQLRPAQQVIMMSGYRIEQLLSQVTGNPVRVLRKPFDTAGLLAMLGEVGRKGLILVISEDADASTHTQQQLEAQRRCAGVVTQASLPIQVEGVKSMDVLILDLNLPVLRCLDSYLSLREAGCEVPLLLFLNGSGCVAGGDELRSLVHTGCLFKPFDPEALIEVVAGLAAGTSSQGARL